MGGLIFIIIIVMTAGFEYGLVAAAVLGVLLLLVTVRDAHGFNRVHRLGAFLSWQSIRAKGSNIYRSGPLSMVPWGTYQLPGVAAPLRLSEHRDSYGRPFALLYVPVTGTYTVVIGTEPDGSALVDQENIDLWVADWGHWLANLGEEPGVQAASVTIETAPDTGSRLRREVNMQIDSEAPEPAKAMLREVVAKYPSGAATVRAYVTISFGAAARTGGKRREAEDMGRELATRMPGLTSTLQATGAGAARPLSAQEICEVVRAGFDPAAALLIDEAKSNGDAIEMRWQDVGPAAHQAEWDSYVHDSGVSCSWTMTGAPRGVVQSGVLRRLLAPHRDVDRKRVSLLFRPIEAGVAAGLVEADLRAAQFQLTTTTNPAARDVMMRRAAEATANEEAAGAGLVEFGLVVTATVSSKERLPDAKAAIDNLGASARLRLRPAYGAQDSTFAASLPLGLILPRMLNVPTELRELV